MNLDPLSLTITVSDGDRTRTLPALALAAALRISPREVCDVLRFLLDPGDGEPFDGKGGRGEGERSERSETFTLENIYISERLTFGEGPGEPERVERLARMVAERLDDLGSVAGFKKLAEVHPEPLLEEALRRTLRIPADRITRSRGACFTGIVRKLVEASWTAPADAHA